MCFAEDAADAVAASPAAWKRVRGPSADLENRVQSAVLPGSEPFALPLQERLARALAGRPAGRAPRTQHSDERGRPRFSNRLLLESSPYLLQHAHNPVNWFPWGDEAFAEAARLARPVFLAIGYSTCHWCHVRENESFADAEIARFLNTHYVAVKVDREERPDIDAIYMSAVQQLTGSGGWPMSVWPNAAREPFLAGSYFPPRDGERGARLGFVSLLNGLSDILSDASGGFPSATDADSKGVEGRFFVWSEGEIRHELASLGEATSTRFLEHYGVRRGGTWQGSNILHVPQPDEQAWAALAGARARLREVRARRVQTQRDEKVLASWNGLMISALAQAGRILDHAPYVLAAARAAEFALTRLRGAGGRLQRCYTDGQARQNAFLDDHVFLVAGLIDLYEATFEPRHLREALLLAEATEDLFADPAGGWFMTSPRAGKPDRTREACLRWRRAIRHIACPDERAAPGCLHRRRALAAACRPCAVLTCGGTCGAAVQHERGAARRRVPRLHCPRDRARLA